MGWFEKYILANKEKIAILLGLSFLLAILDELVWTNNIGWLTPITTLLFVSILLVLVWIGWDGHRKLHYHWTDGPIAATLIGFVLFLMNMLANIQMLGAELRADPSLFAISVVFNAASIIVVSGALVFIGQVAARVLAPQGVVKVGRAWKELAPEAKKGRRKR